MRAASKKHQASLGSARKRLETESNQFSQSSRALAEAALPGLADKQKGVCPFSQRCPAASPSPRQNLPESQLGKGERLFSEFRPQYHKSGV